MAPTIPDLMRAMQQTRSTTPSTPYTQTTVAVPAVSLQDLLVKVAAASYCHTDGMVAAGVFATALPHTASHEGAGTVVRVGPHAAAARFAVGDRVMCGIPLHPCGACADCAGGEGGEGGPQYCARVDGHVGVHLDGCLAEYVRVDARFSTRLPDGLSLTEAAPLACAGRTAWRGVRVAGVPAGAWLLILGSGGGLGHLAVQFAKALGARVIGVDARDAGLELSREVGADVVLDAREGTAAVVGEVRRVTGGGVHAAIVLSDAPGATALAAAATRMHGTVVQIAQPETVEVPFQDIVFRDVRIRGSLLCSPEESRDMVDFMAGLKERGRGIRVVTTVFEGMEMLGEVLLRVKMGEVRGKAVIVVDRKQVEEDERRGG
ncbi:GroES-like protein [Jackrogersella minutella]|nr:GroES-like protein [Jackrogersella minutella]